jgi:hypothetical protein
MKLIPVILALALISCASNKVSVTDRGQTADASDIARCTVMIGDEMVDKEYCLTYESTHCQVQVGDCVILK